MRLPQLAATCARRPIARRCSPSRPRRCARPSPRWARAPRAAAGHARLAAGPGGRARPGAAPPPPRGGPLPPRPASSSTALADHFLRVVPPRAWPGCIRAGATCVIEALAGDAGERRAFLHALRGRRRARSRSRSPAARRGERAPARCCGGRRLGRAHRPARAPPCRSSTTWTRAGCCTDSTRR